MEINRAAEILSDYLNTHKPIKQEYSAEQIADLMNRQIDMRLQAFGSDDEPSVQPEQLRADLELMRSNLSDIQGILDDVENKLLKVGLEIDDVNENLTNSFRELEKYRDAAKEDIERAEALLDVNQTREVAGAYDEAEREADQAEHDRILSDMRGESDNMITVSVYKDTTDLYTQEEMDEDNVADLLFPESIVRDYAAENEDFLDDFMASYTADDTVGLVAFAKERGFEVSRPFPAEDILRALGSTDMSLTDYVTENYSAAVSVMEHGGSLYDLDSMIAMKEALGRDITYDEFSKVNGTDIFDDMGLYNVTQNDVPLIEAILSDKVHNVEEARVWEEERTGLPDPSVTLEDMQEYGYSYENMLPLGTDRAKELFAEAEVFHLYPDGSEGVVDNIEEFDNATAGTIWGIEKDMWEVVQGRDRESINQAKEAISEFLYSEYGNDNPRFDDLSSIGLAYTTLEAPDDIGLPETRHNSKGEVAIADVEIQVDADLLSAKIDTYIDGDLLRSVQYDSLKDMLHDLQNLDFDDLVRLSDNDWKWIADKQIDKEAAAAIDEHEAEFGADGRRVFPRLNETKEETLAAQIDRFMYLSMPSEYNAAIDSEKNIKTITEFLKNGHFDEVKRLFNDVIRHGNAETPELEEMALNLSAQVNDLEAEANRAHSKAIPELTGTEYIAQLSDEAQERLRAAISKINGADVETAMAGRLNDLEENLDWKKELNKLELASRIGRLDTDVVIGFDDEAPEFPFTRDEILEALDSGDVNDLANAVSDMKGYVSALNEEERLNVLDSIREYSAVTTQKIELSENEAKIMFGTPEEAAKAIKAPEVETKHLSNETKQMIDSANSHRIDSSIEAAKAAPGIAYGIADITAGEKVSGVISLAKAAPSAIKSKAEKAKANIDDGKSLKSLHNDMKDLSAKEKMEAMKEFAEYKAASAVNTVKDKPGETVDDIKGAAVSVMDFADKDNGHADHVAVVDKVADGVLGGLKDGSDKAKPEVIPEKMANHDKITVSVSSKLVGEPFKAKDGNFYVRVKLPNENKADKSPWGSIVVKPDQVTENKVTGKTDISLNANGTVTIYKPELVCYNQINQPEYINRKTKISTADLKKKFMRTEPKNIKSLITTNTKRKDEINQQKQQKDNQIDQSAKKNNRTGRE